MRYGVPEMGSTTILSVTEMRPASAFARQNSTSQSLPDKRVLGGLTLMVAEALRVAAPPSRNTVGVDQTPSVVASKVMEESSRCHSNT